MDIKELIKLIIEVVDEVMKQENQIVVGIFFNKDNEPKLKEECKFNEIFYYKDFEESALPDVLYLDFISISLLPHIALGLENDNISKLIKNMLLNGKKIIVLGLENEEVSSCNEGYSKLFENYYKILESYGIIFKNKMTNLIKTNVFDGKVLTKKDILICKEHREIIVKENTVITMLAKEEAIKYNIKIVKV